MILKKHIILLLALCPFLTAAKIYKWTDANGKVQFTQTPGPTQEVKSIYRDTRKNKKTRKSLSGWWYGRAAGKIYKIQFKGDSFSFMHIYSKHGTSSIGNGFYEYENGIIKLKYVNSPHSKNKGGTIDEFTIIDFTVSKLTFRSKNNTIYKFIKDLKHDPSRSQYVTDLYGIWLNRNNDEVLEFKISSFRQFDKGKYSQRGSKAAYRGNWILHDDTIEFQYLGNSEYISKIGLTEKYKIVFSNELLTMKNIKTGKSLQYKKQLLNGDLL